MKHALGHLTQDSQTKFCYNVFQLSKMKLDWTCRGGHTVNNSLLRRMLRALGKTLTVLALSIT